MAIAREVVEVVVKNKKKSMLRQYFETVDEEQHSSAAIAFYASIDNIVEYSPNIAHNIVKELRDQRSYIKLIASENFSSLSVQQAMGNLLCDKYSEGYVGHRFYAGCENIDSIEGEANDLLREIFGADHAYVQPHSGCDANLVAFWSILVHKVQDVEVEKLGKKNIDALTNEEYERVRQLLMNQTVMGMALDSGGHLTHGYRHNISAKMMRAVSYHVDFETGALDYDAIHRQAQKEKPTILLAGYSAYPRRIDFSKMREIADSVGAVLMVDMAHFAGLVAGKVFTGVEDPVPYADIITSTTHKTMRGPRGGFILCKEEFAPFVDKGCPLVLGGPLPHVIAAKAVAFREVLKPSYQEYAQRVVDNAKTLAEALIEKGVKLFTGGTDNHLIVCEVASLGITGRHAERALREAGLTVNRNAIPSDPNGPWYTSGIRIGTPATTSLGMGAEEMKAIAGIIADVLHNTKPTISQKTNAPSKALCSTDEKVLEASRKKVAEILGDHPLYPELVLSGDEEILDT
jgi:glycine hydroxymethyltransferase